MRCFSILLLILFKFSFSASGQFTYRVEGTVRLQGPVFAYLYIPASPQGLAQVQQARILNNRFVFSGNLSAAPERYVLARIYFDSSAVYKPAISSQKTLRSSFVEILLDSILQISVTNDTLLQSVSGSKLNEVYFKLQQIRSPRPATIEQQLNYYSAISAFLARYPSTVFSKEVFDRLMRLPSGLINRLIPDILSACSSVDSIWLRSPLARSVFNRALKANAVRKFPSGSLLPDHIFYDGSDSVSINQFSGKYLLIYFCASWSVPGSQYQNELEQAFLQYPVTNFSILQVSLDRDINTWRKFFQGRKVLWKQARLIKGWDEKVVSVFDIKGLPHTYLIDPSGKIIGQNLTSRQIIEFLRKLPG